MGEFGRTTRKGVVLSSAYGGGGELASYRILKYANYFFFYFVHVEFNNSFDDMGEKGSTPII
jgi:hypothetical protein